ncbi:uroporphyrinogen-III synthase [Larsenimonas rhizosphaerae]|uniref:uroporphyrinogen-III synthase n=1 Tax=Larsenimonas rhizosphaerae TaxID=2944682 RepID=UPI002033F3EC|nr:uroporphyrinogen-III synthase [Larsenimonas rhizosphaerae]MCM2131507.1 uroporphyrinogen-III synthase [Larsenimonas rhizosphaerae]
MARADLPVVIARPGARAEALDAALRADGHAIEQLNIMSLSPLDDEEGAIRRRLLDLDLYRQVICTSPFAAQCLVEQIEAVWPQLPVGIEYLATGTSTADVLADGLSVDVSFPPMGSGSASEALLALPTLAADNVSGHRILLAGGQGGRPLLHETLMQRGASVDTLALYRRQLHEPELTHQHLLSEGRFSALVLTSAEQLEHLLVWCDRQTFSRPLVVSSERLATLAYTHGFDTVMVAGDASPNALSAAVARACSAF